ncbi:Serine/Threonine kinase domain protein (macronuclear) [Tetrahymena thermophila SB210]|uniref:non-specific serine/threonine protein kinase n=1 Tax=Tetrahymena thermophila (strain SB210) TaxID=312017 RepID=I7MJV0_TETTS|nr:Serine/Threonine kinase domain protein [Tetrahymena thermophila SB210]EAR97221.2 Serine/Threonine kinase domain protein [Tetrahymena thermophila SB210]|eukprot:XP_001017466.2 Serine/Threonine kinase domain protein [Tetrahymena thermophila SB210]
MKFIKMKQFICQLQCKKCQSKQQNNNESSMHACKQANKQTNNNEEKAKKQIKKQIIQASWFEEKKQKIKEKEKPLVILLQILQQQFVKKAKETRFFRYLNINTVYQQMLHEQLEILSKEKIYENNFIQLQKIGQGGFASVYRVVHKIDDTEYAVKQIHLKIKDIKEDLQKHYEKLIREARYLAQVNHPNVIRYFHSWIEVTEKKKSQKQEEQKRQTLELSSSFAKKKKSKDNNNVSPSKKDKKEDKQLAIQSNQANLKQQPANSNNPAGQNQQKVVDSNKGGISQVASVQNKNSDATNIHIQAQTNNQKGKQQQQQQVNQGKQTQQIQLNNQDQSDEDNNEDSNTFYFEDEFDNEVVFIEENSKSIKQDESQQENSHSSGNNLNQSNIKSNNDMSDQSPIPNPNVASKQKPSQIKIFNNNSNGNSAEIPNTKKSSKDIKKLSEFSSAMHGNNNEESQENDSQSFNKGQSDFQLVFESYSEKSKSDLKDECKQIAPDNNNQNTSKLVQNKKQDQGEKKNINKCNNNNNQNKNQILETKKQEQNANCAINNKNNKNSHDILKNNQISQQTQNNNNNNKNQLQQNQQQNQANSISNTKSYERRKNKSMDYLTIDQKQREFQLDKYDEIIFYLQTELCHQTLAEYITNRNKKLFSQQQFNQNLSIKNSCANISNNSNIKNQNLCLQSTQSMFNMNESNSFSGQQNSINNNLNQNNLMHPTLTYSNSCNCSDPFDILTFEYKQQAIAILKEIIKGLYHIHHICKMVHRDLKPHNIFLTDNMQVKIGDFGLVKKLSKLINPNQKIQYNDHQLYGKKLGNDNSGMKQTSTNNSFSGASTSPSETNSGYHDKLPFYLPKEEITSTCGTATYASPEQLSQKAEFFDHRADIYSLGIIILQLFHPMNTSMELVKTIQNCKKGELPKHFCAKFPRLAEIIKDSLSNDPQKRPLLSKIEQTLQEMEMMESQVHCEILGKLMITFESETTQSVKFVKVIRNSLYFYKNETIQKAENVYNIQECTFRLVMGQHGNVEEIAVQHPIQQNFSIRAIQIDKNQLLIQKLQKYSIF